LSAVWERPHTPLVILWFIASCSLSMSHSSGSFGAFLVMSIKRLKGYDGQTGKLPKTSAPKVSQCSRYIDLLLDLSSQSPSFRSRV
jgi:hypothetical protein